MTGSRPSPDRRGALLIVGATSGAGKSTVTAGLCRAWRWRGLDVAPFKAQNMSNHAAVTTDGGEIGRAQAEQAAAAGVPLDRRMNPILLKPGSDRRSHVVVMGEERVVTDAHDYGRVAASLRPVALQALTSLRGDHPWVIAEGAGGAAEINLLDRDLVNLPLARAAGVPAVLVVDIDRGGAFAAAYGTIALVPGDLRATVAGVVFNRFRGDPSLLEPGIADLEARTGVPVLGVLPHLGATPLLGVEDSLDVTPATGSGSDADRPVRVAAIRLPHLANPSDLDPFRVEPHVALRWVTAPSELVDADLIVLPGSRSTVEDLRWLERRGLARSLVQLARRDTTRIVGLCAGYQMLGTGIHDFVESGVGMVDALGLLRAVTRFEPTKVVRRSTGHAGTEPVHGYQIRFGCPVSEDPWLEVDGEPEGSVDPTGRVSGSSLHGLFDADGFRTALLTEVAERRGRIYAPAPVRYVDLLDDQHDRLADWLDTHLDLDEWVELAGTAAAPGTGPGW
ncbi:MAG: cobyric acid synthase [Acidimicrobiales bacterium]